MKQDGFIASALLYGILALFLVLMTNTLYIFSANKVSMDKMKEKAFETSWYFWFPIHSPRIMRNLTEIIDDTDWIYI